MHPQRGGAFGATRRAGGQGRAAAVVVAVVVALLAGGTPVLLAHAPPAGAVGAGNILKRWAATMSGSQTLTQDQAVTDARNYDVLVAKKDTFTPYLGAMRAANPGVKVLDYLNGAYAQQNQGPTSGAYPTTWYAKDVSGQYITSRVGGNWLMDVSNPSWIQDRVQTCSSFITGSGYDGCYLDVLGNVSVSPSYVSSVPFNQVTGQNWTAPDWLTATANLGAAVKNANSSAFIVGNGLQNGQQYFTASQGPTSKLLSGMDGGNAQGWLRGASDAIDSFETEADWLNDVNLVVDAGARGRSALTMTKVWNVSPTPTQQQLDAVHRYALASFLLGTNGNQYFLFDTDPDDGAVATDHPYDHVNVGTATDSFSKDGSGAYVRHFTMGVAVVNPGTTTVTESLGAPMTDLDGNVMSQVTLPPDSGDVFTTSATTTSTPCTGTLTGTAYKGGRATAKKALAGVVLTATPTSGTPASAITDAAGAYSVSAPCGTYTKAATGPETKDRVCHFVDKKGPTTAVATVTNGSNDIENLFCLRK